MRVMRGADFSLDHHYLLTAVKHCLKMLAHNSNTQPNCNVGLLRSEGTKAEFRISLSCKFHTLQELVDHGDREFDIH